MAHDNTDPRVAGVGGLKGLKGPSQTQSLTEDEIQKMLNRNTKQELLGTYKGASTISDFNLSQPGSYQGTYLENYGSSQYDRPMMSMPSEEDVQENRYNEQPWYDVLANGLGKMFGKAGTTFASSVIGLPYGLFKVAQTGDASALWDNDVTQALSNVDKWFEENMTNYKSLEQQQDPSFRFGDLNWWADNLITNAGFALGSAASMAVGGGAMGLMSKALKFTNDVGKATKGGVAVLSSLFSATGEGMIEAKNGVEERNKLEMQRLNDAFAPERAALDEEYRQINQEYEANRNRFLVRGVDGSAYDPAYETFKQKLADYNVKAENLKQRYEAGKQQIEESGKRMGNAILALNQVFLSAGNLIQYGKSAVKGFNSARHAAEINSKYAKPFGMWTEKLADGTYKTHGKNLARGIAATKGLLTEGSEEMNQQWIQSGSEAYYKKKDVNDYWRAKLNPEAYKDTVEGTYTLGDAISQGFRDSWGTFNQYEQFLIGAITGATGMYMPTKVFNQDKSKSRWNPMRYGDWNGGALIETREANRKANQFQENIDELNSILSAQDFPARVKSLIGHTYTQKQKDAAAEGDDKKAYKDAEDKQMIHDIQAFLRAGKLDDLRAIYDEVGSQMSDEDIENLVKNTTKEITEEEDRKGFNSLINKEISAHHKKIDELNQRAQAIGDSQDMLEGGERTDYQAAVRPEVEKIFEQVDKEYEAIAKLEQQKEQYQPKRYYDGPYVDEKGNKTITDEELKGIIKHNSEELNRKLNSYLDSIDAVNKDTKGTLTKDQEDNLAYLHNLGRESLVRADKIINERRKELPTKFLMKTDKTPEQLSKEYASSDLVFSKDENTKEGYVEVDTSLMDDRSFRNFFIRELLWGRNIDPEFGETADEKAAREEEEKNLSEEERKKKVKERLSKKLKEGIEKKEKNAKEQRATNGNLIMEHLINNLKKNTNKSPMEIQQAINDFFQDIIDAEELISQAGEYDKTLREYMANPSKVDEDRAKAESEAQKVADEQQAKNKFAGKSATKIKQDVASGNIDFGELDDFISAGGLEDDSLVGAQQEAKKAKEGIQKTAALKQHVMESDADPTIKDAAIAMLDNANLNTEDPDEINLDSEFLKGLPLDVVTPNADINDVTALEVAAQDLLARMFNEFNEDKNAQSDIPDSSEIYNDVEEAETGKDPVVKSTPEVVAPNIQSPSEAANNPIPKNPLTEDAIDTVISGTAKATAPQNINGTWRSTTTRYGKYKKNDSWIMSDKPYYQLIQDKGSLLYKRYKAIWEYFNEQGVFDRQDDTSDSRIKEGEPIHFMVKNMSAEIFGKPYKELTDEEKPVSLVIMMLNDNGEILGDLPLAEWEPSYKSGEPTEQTKLLKALQDKVFDAYDNHLENATFKDAIVDGSLHKEGVDNLNLMFNSKNPLVSKVSQVMRGAVPYRKSETNTLNDVANGQPLELGVAVNDNTIAKKRGDKTYYKDIVMPKVGTVGQPYLLLPAPSGEKVAVPFYMKPFNAGRHQDTEMYKMLSNAIYSIITNNTNKEVFKKNMDVIEGLLQVKVAEGVPSVITVNKNSITMYLQSLTDKNQKITITVPFNQDAGEAAKAIVDQLSGIPINVSLQFLNSTIEAGGRKANYNNVIGEIADVNLPKDTNHTVNGWFTVELTSSTGTKSSKKLSTRTTGITTMNIGGRNVDVDADNLKAFDPISGEQIMGDEEINLTLAQIKADKSPEKGRIKIEIDGKLRTYDTEKKKFVSNETVPDRSTVLKDARLKKIEDTLDLHPGDIILDNKNTKYKVVGYKWSSTTPMRNASGNNDVLGEPYIILDYNEEGKNIEVSAEQLYKRGVKKVNKEGSSSENSTISEEQQKKIQELTIEQINEVLKQKKIVSRQTKDAWDTIPDELKLKLVNDGQPLQLSFGGKTVVVSLSDVRNLIKGLTQANMAAKTGNLKVSEAPKYREANDSEQKKADMQKEKRWLQNNLPMFSNEDRLKLVQGLIEIPGGEGWAWGRFQSGVITLSNMAAAGTTYHEAFHAVTQTLLDDEELDTLYEAAKERYGKNNIALLEELLAEDFRKYVIREETPIIGYIRKIFRRILHAIKSLSSYRDPINNLFYEINNGNFKDTIPRADRGNNAFYSEVRTDRLLDKEHPMHQAIKESFDKKNWVGDFPAINARWRRFKDAWQAEGYTPVRQAVYSEDGKGKLIFLGVRTNEDEALSKKEYSRKQRTTHGAKQAREGGLENLRWENLDPDQQMYLMNDGITEEKYNKMSLEEKDQVVKCRT